MSGGKSEMKKWHLAKLLFKYKDKGQIFSVAYKP